MLIKVLKMLSGVVFMLGFICFIGTMGAYECDMISGVRAIIQGIVYGLVAFFGFYATLFFEVNYGV